MPKFFENLDEKYIEENFSGILVIADVHGDYQSFNNAVIYAKAHNLYMVSLGDLVDYGPHSKDVISFAKKLHDEKKLSIVLGNHERKLFKYFIQKSEGKIRLTVKAAMQASIDSFGDDTSAVNDFNSLHSNMSNVIKYKSIYFTHGALQHDIINTHEYSPVGYQMALFGEIDANAPKRESGYPNRIYNWVDKIPENIKVYVGHDIRSTDHPVTEKSVTFLDTGCSKDGFLSCAVLNKNGILIEFERF